MYKHCEKRKSGINHQNLKDLPDEVLLRIFYFLDVESLLRCSQVSKRIRKLCHDNSLWQKCDVEYGNFGF